MRDTGIVLVILALGFWPVVTFQSILKWDIIDINLPWRYFIGECTSNGILPLWNPYINSGFPQGGDPMTWYPIAWVTSWVWGHNLAGLQYEFILHILVAAIGSYFFCSLFRYHSAIKIFVAISFALSGFFIGNAQHYGWIIGAAWFPWVLFFFVRFCNDLHWRHGILLVICLYLMLSGGYPGLFVITAYSLLLIGVFYVWKNRKNITALKSLIFHQCTAGAVFLILSMVVWVLGFELSKHLYQVTKFTPEFVQSHPLPLQALISFFFPYATTQSTDFFGTDFSMVNCYVGVFTWVLCIYAVIRKDKNAIILLFLGLAFLTIALADIFPFRRWLYYLPYMNIFRFPPLFRLFACFSFILAAARGLNIMIFETNSKKAFTWAIVAITTCIMGFIAYGFFNIELWKFKTLWSGGFLAFEKVAELPERTMIQAFIVIVVLGLAFWAGLQLRRSLVLYVFLILAAVDMLQAARLNFFHTVSDRVSPWPTHKAIQQLPKGFPIPSLSISFQQADSLRQTSIPQLWRNINIFYKQPCPSGYTPYFLTNQVYAENTIANKSILNNPLLFLADCPDQNRIKDSNSFDTNSYRKIEILDFKPTQVTLRTGLDRNQILTYLQNDYPGWEITVNGKPVPIIRAHYTYLSCLLDSGQSIVSFSFRPWWIILSFYVSATTLAALTGIALILWCRKKEAV
jgi:hypothetical protein